MRIGSSGIFLGLCLTMLALPFPGRAATINAASCAPTDVQAAHTAASAGDTIQLPTCTISTWNTTVTITKAVTLRGNGMANTILHRQRVAADYESNEMIKVTNVTGFVAQDFAMEGTQDTDPKTWTDMAIHLSNCVDFRIHDMAFSFFAIALQVHGDPTVQRGVIDHNTFTDINTDPTGTLDSYGYGVSPVGNGTYPALTLGTSQNVFIEDNTFTRNKSAVQSNNGSRHVFRHNTVVDGTDHQDSVDAHGFTGAWPRGTRQWEVYDNTLTASGERWTGIRGEGGDGVIFNNVIDTDYLRDIALENADCSGTYPQQDQIREVYVWNNTVSGGGSAVVTNGCTSLIQLNRDYFLSARPGYTAYTYPHPATLAASEAAPQITRIIR